MNIVLDSTILVSLQDQSLFWELFFGKSGSESNREMSGNATSGIGNCFKTRQDLSLFQHLLLSKNAKQKMLMPLMQMRLRIQCNLGPGKHSYYVVHSTIQYTVNFGQFFSFLISNSLSLSIYSIKFLLYCSLSKVVNRKHFTATVRKE